MCSLSEVRREKKAEDGLLPRPAGTKHRQRSRGTSRAAQRRGDPISDEVNRRLRESAITAPTGKYMVFKRAVTASARPNLGDEDLWSSASWTSLQISDKMEEGGSVSKD